MGFGNMTTLPFAFHQTRPVTSRPLHARLNRAYLWRLLSLGVGGDEHGTKLQELASAMSDGDVADAKRGASQRLKHFQR